MPALVDLSDLINRSTGGASGTPENVFYHKTSRIAGVTAPSIVQGRWASMWQYDGQPAGGVVPGAVVVPTAATVGALLPFTNPGGGRDKWLTQAWASSLNTGTLLLYDRLLHVGGLSGTVTAPQTVGGTLTRAVSGVGNIAFAEVYTQIGATATTVTMSYSNTVPTSGRISTAVTFGGTNFREATRAIMLPLQAGDTGVSAIASVTVLASTAVAGNFGVTIGRPLAYMPCSIGGLAGWRDFTTGLPGIPRLEANSCLGLLWMSTTTAPTELFGGLSSVEA